MGFAQGKRNAAKSLSLSEEDIRYLREIESKGIKVYFQMLPQDRKIKLEELVKWALSILQLSVKTLRE